MSNFSIVRNNNRINKKNLTDLQDTVINNSASLGASYDIYNANVTSLTLNNTTLTVDTNDLEYLNTTAGAATANKSLVVDSDRNLTDINTISCNSIVVNGVTIPSSNSTAASNSYLTEITPGIAGVSKSLVVDNNKNISNINTLSLNSLNSDNLNIYTSKSKQNFNFSNYSYNTINTTNNWTSVCWSPKLNLFAAISNTGTNNRIMTSSDGITWTAGTSPADNNWTSVCWSPELSLFVAVSSSGTDNRIMNSANGIDWNINNITYNNYYPVISDPNSDNVIFGYDYTIVLLNDGAVKSWGKNFYGQLGNGTSGYDVTLIPETINSLSNVNKLFSGYNCTFALLNDGTVKAWGANSDYQLGNNTNVNQSTPITIPEFFNAVKIVNTGSSYSHTLALFNDGTVKACGRNYYGALIQSDTALIYKVPTLLSNISNVIDIGCGYANSTFLLNDGTIKTCGNGAQGLLGNNTITQTQTSLVNVIGITNAISIKCGAINSYAILNDGTIKAWGMNANGQLGNNNIIFKGSPVTVSGITNANKLALGYESCMAILNDGTIKVWGNNTSGQLGLGHTTSPQLLPVTNTNITNYTSVHFQNSNIGYISKNDILYTCGAGISGQLGNNTILTRSNFDYVWNDISGMALNNFKKIYNNIGNTDYKNNNWSSIIWSSNLNLFTAISNSGNENRIITSSDGLIWNSQLTAANNNWTSICYSQELSLFVAVSSSGIGNRIMQSSNFINWTAVKSPADNNWKSVCWSPKLSLFVAIANSGTSRIMISKDGKFWKNINSPKQYNYQSIIWIPKLSIFVAISLSGNSDKIIQSSDGLSWRTCNLKNVNNNLLNCMCWSDSLNKLLILSSNNNNSSINYVNDYLPYWNLSNSYNGVYNDASYKSIEYAPSLNLIIAIGSKNTVIRSTDGCNWEYCTTPLSQFTVLNDICWSPELSLFVIVTVSNLITSSDGITWTSRTNPSPQNLVSVCWSSTLSLFVAVVKNAITALGAIITSPDGITWTSRTSATNGTWNKVIWANTLSLFIAVGSSAGSRVMTSPNGTTWTTRTAAVENNWTSVTYSDSLNLLVAVSDSGTANRVMTSTNGTTWIVRTTPSTTRNWQNIIWVSDIGYFIAVANDANKEFMYSTDGTVWAYIALPLGNYLYSLVWVSHLKCIVSVGYNNSSNIIKTNNLTNLSILSNANNISDSINLGCLYKKQNVNKSTIKYCLNNWYYTKTLVNTTWTSICWSPTLRLYVAISNSGSNRLNISYDGYLWSSGSIPVNNNWVAICWSPELSLFVAIANSGVDSRVMTSINGLNWISRTTPIDNNWSAITWSSKLNLFVVVANSGTGDRIMTSNDGITWITKKSPADNDWSSICWSSDLNLFVAGASSGTNNRIMYSSDGYTWFLTDCLINNNWDSICWSSELSLFVAVSITGENNRIITSPDGITWTSRISPEDNNWNTVMWVSQLNIFIAIASSGTNRLMYSYDGINWKSVNLAINNAWVSICWNYENGTLTMISNDGVNNQVINSNHFYVNSSNTISSYMGAFNEQNGYFYYNAVPSVLLNTTLSLTHQVEINSNLTNLILYSKNADIINIGINIDGEFNVLTTNTSFNIVNHNGIDQGLSLNNILVTATANKLNSYKIITNGNASANNILIPNSDLNIYNINSLSINTLNTSDVFSLITPGIAKSTLPLLTDVNNNISNLNKLSLKSLVSNNNTMTCFDNNFKNNVLYNTVFYSTKLISPSTVINNIIWVSDLNLYIGTAASTRNIVYSPNGANWTAINIGGSSSLYSVAWSPALSLLVACGQNAVFTSTDGITWSSSTSPANYKWQSITWSPSLNLFAMAAQNTGVDDTTIATSPNGITWTLRTSAVASWTKIIWVSELNLFITIASGSSAVSTSPNGINWTRRTTPSVSLTDITYSSSLNILLACSTSTTTNKIIKSTDGITWTDVGATMPLRSLNAILWISDLNIFVCATTLNNTDSRIMISKDGINWYYRSTKNMNYSYCNFAYSSKYKQIVCATNNSYIVYSNVTGTNNYIEPSIDIKKLNNILPSDGTILNTLNTWYPRSSANNNTWSSVCWSSTLNLFAAVANSGIGNRIMTSINGITWVAQTNPVDNNWTSVCWSSELSLFVAVANSGTGDRIMTSTDGITWISRTNPVDNNWTSVCWSSELSLFVVVANSGTGDRIMTSADGTSWTSRTSPVDNNWSSVCWASELSLFVAVANSGTGDRIMSSADGSSWTSRTSPADNNWNSVCWNSDKNLFISVASTGSKRVMTSVDGISWTLQSASINNNWISVIYIAEIGYSVALSNSSKNNIMFSRNGIDWISCPFSGINCSSICWSPDYSILLIVAQSGINQVYNSKIILSTYKNTITFNPRYFKYSETNNAIALGDNNSNLMSTYQLSLMTDSAAKPGTSTWTISSDIRLKEDIEDADLDLCYNNIKNLPLKKYKWKDEFYTNDQIYDRHKIGWIAQDVEAILPKSVTTNSLYGIEDCKLLDIDQIIATLYGSIKKLIQICELRDTKLIELENKKKILTDYIDSIEIVNE